MGAAERPKEIPFIMHARSRAGPALKLLLASAKPLAQPPPIFFIATILRITHYLSSPLLHAKTAYQAKRTPPEKTWLVLPPASSPS